MSLKGATPQALAALDLKSKGVMQNGRGARVIRWSSSTAAAIVEHRRATSRVCLRIAVQNGPNQGLGVAVQVPLFVVVIMITTLQNLLRVSDSNSVHDIDTEIDAEDPDSDDDDELSHSPSWYRFRPSTSTIEGTSTILEARHRYVALVEDVFRDREFHGVLGKEYIDGEVHYLVDWVPTLVRGHVLHKAKAQPLISQFEASCEAQREKRKRPEAYRSNGFGATDGTQRKR
ncbi:hypothetical protein BDZ45DRAFT_93283 [Acephala macrosclerotiorum]|nr:hypothetical protein BDZ45DRAFT_93283 [Acephala macrosclerotiorum]